MNALTPASLAEILRYDPATGVLFWRERPESTFQNPAYARRINQRLAGREALTGVGSHGYRAGRIGGQQVLAHRACWALVHGAWPTEQIDHVNGDRLDNRLRNLRAVSNAENSRNQSMKSTNTSGVTGVSWNRRCEKWSAAIRVAGRLKFLGYFADINDAAEARAKANLRYGYSSRHGLAA